MSRVLKATWIAASLVVLAVTLTRYDGRPNSDVDVFLAYGMLTLSFPSGFVAAAILALASVAADRLWGHVIHSGYVYLCAAWLLFFAAGYLQWFVSLPWINRKWKHSRSGGVAKQDR